MSQLRSKAFAATLVVMSARAISLLALALAWLSLGVAPAGAEVVLDEKPFGTVTGAGVKDPLRVVWQRGPRHLLEYVADGGISGRPPASGFSATTWCRFASSEEPPSTQRAARAAKPSGES